MRSSALDHRSKIRLSMAILILVSLAFLILGCGEDEGIVDPKPVQDDLGLKPPLPRPESLNDTAESEVLTIIRPLLDSDLKLEVSAAKANWSRLRRSCNDDWLGGGCNSWAALDNPQGLFSDSPEVVYCGAKPFNLLTITFMQDGVATAPMGQQNWVNYSHLCNWDCGDDNCWYNISWYGNDFEPMTSTPYLRRDRYWVREESTLADEGTVSQEHTTTYTHGVEETECQEFAGSISVEFTEPYGVVTATLTASYSVAYSNKITKSTIEEKKFTIRAASPGHVSIYEVWSLVDRYTVTDENGDPFSDPNYKILPSRPFHVQGIEVANLVTEFEDVP